MSTINPIYAMDTIRQTYLRYLRTVAPFQDAALHKAFRQETEKADMLVKGPLLEAAPPFMQGRTIAQLVKDGVLHTRFLELCSEVLPSDRPLYLHQDRAITHLTHRQRNIIVATGTGSGKTETFLLPIFHHLLQEEEKGTLDEPGVRALLLYPMNALANDQLRRLRHLLANYPTITFGRYTGETPEQDSAAEDRFREQFPYEPLLPNELLSRTRMRARPPHILLTNYAMLEYLLLRPEDCELFDGDTGHHWRYLVLDEAHTYDGASGIELAMLLRRLKDRIVESQPGRLRCIATSATLGKGENDFPAAIDFASNLFGEAFEWSESDLQRRDVIEAIRQPIAALGDIWGEGSIQLYTTLKETIATLPDALDTPQDLISSLSTPITSLIPEPILQSASDKTQQQWYSEEKSDTLHSCVQTAIDAFLHTILCGDQRVHLLHSLIGQSPAFLNEIAQQVFPDDPHATVHLVTLVDLAVRARPYPETLSLLPARYHAFARALEGAFACLNKEEHKDHQPHLFLNRHELCPECGGWVVELAACMRCGAAYIVGTENQAPNSQELHQSSKGLILRQWVDTQRGRYIQPAYFLLGTQGGQVDEDEVIVVGDELTEQKNNGNFSRLCLLCGLLSNQEQMYCRCGGTTIPLQKLELKKEQEPRSCMHCGARSTSSIILRALTGQDAPVGVLATALYQQLPSSPDPDAIDLPGEGRKLLIFSDSRQDAAFFAPYLERTYNQVLRRRLILQSLLAHKDGRTGQLRMQDVVDALREEAEQAGMFTQNQSRTERLRMAKTWLMQELVALDRPHSLDGVGLLQFRMVRPQRWKPPTALQASPWNLNEDECWALIALLLDTLRQQGVTAFLDGVDPKDEQFAPRNKELFIRKEGGDSQAGILSWLPVRGSNRRQNLLERVLALCAPEISPEQGKQYVREALSGVWDYLTDPRSPWRNHIVSVNRPKCGIVYRLSHEFWELVPLTEEGHVYRCNRCRAYTSLNLKGFCPTLGCRGTIEPFTLVKLRREENHYQELYLELHTLPLSAEEHTAQWTSDEASKVQERFIRGETNVLSCSTTFELGVDVGELQAVLMRNVPPTTANYVQRAGRAGRRTDSAAFALTFAQRRSHDLSYYSHPQQIVAGRISPPRIAVSNEKIIRRHMQAVLLSAFFRHMHKCENSSFPTLGHFFQPKEGPSATERLLSFAEARPEAVQVALKRIVPATMHKTTGIENWSWLRTVDNDGMLDLLERVDAEVTSDLGDYDRAEREAAKERNYGLSAHYKSVTHTIRTRSLLGFLATRNLLPKYGFPTDVVELKTNHLPVPEALRVQLERDLRIAISEYAPGAEVVAAKRVWVGGGLYKQPKHEWPIYRYAICPTCNRFLRRKVEQELENVCTCGSTLQHTGRTFLIPEFGFVAAPNTIRPAGDVRPQRLYSSRIYFAEYTTPQENSATPILSTVEELSSESVEISRYYSRFGKLALVNGGADQRGFRICQICGYAEMAPVIIPGKSKKLSKSKAHTNPRTRKPCEGFTQTHHLGHEFLTDVVEIRFEGPLARQAHSRLWRSLLYSLLEGASQALQIRRDDLDGTLYFPRRGEPAALMLFDNVPGGAGHVERIGKELYTVFGAAYERVKNECCGPETSCYECLRNYRNQSYHDELVRGEARDFLFEVLTAAKLMN